MKKKLLTPFQCYFLEHEYSILFPQKLGVRATQDVAWKSN